MKFNLKNKFLGVSTLATVFATFFMSAQASAIRVPVYNCTGIAGKNSVCIDPTTGYGPVIYVFQGTTSIWAHGVTRACTQFGMDGAPHTRWYDSGNTVYYTGPWGNNITVTSVSTPTTCTYGNADSGIAVMPQSVIDQFRWTANSHNATTAVSVL